MIASSVRRWWPRSEWDRRAGTSRPRRRPRGRGALAALAGAGAAAVLAPVLAAGPASALSAPPPAAGLTPAVAAVGTSAHYVIWTAADGSVWMHNPGTGANIPAGGHLVSGPAAITSGASVILFGEGTDHQLWYNSCNTFGACGSWLPLGGTITSTPGAAVQGTNAADFAVYARGTNGAVWGRNHTSSGWSGWYSAGGNLLAGTGPAAAYLGGTYVLATGIDRHLYIAKVGATGFSPAGGSTTASPGLTALSTGQGPALLGFARGTDNVAYYHRFLSSSPGWHSMGGRFSSGLSAMTWNVGSVTVGLGTDGQVYDENGNWTTYPPAFSGWFPVGG
jgi:hypothetical protein